MGDLIIKDSFNELTKENSQKMGNNFTSYNNINKKESVLKHSEETFTDLDKIKTLNKCSNVKKFSLCQEKLGIRHKLCAAHRNHVDGSKQELSNGFIADLEMPVNERLEEMQTNWVELRKCIRFVYKNAISSVPSIVNNDKIPDDIVNTIKELVNRLYEEDCIQLFIRLEVLIRDFVLEARDKLKDLQSSVENVSVLYLKGLLASYGAFCVAAENLAPYLPQLDSILMKRFSVNFEFLNKYLFQICLYQDAFVQNNVPLCISQLRTSEDVQFSNQELVHSYLAFDNEMTDIASRWLDVKKLILKFSKKPLLLEDWEVYKEYKDLMAYRTWHMRKVKEERNECDVQLLSLLDELTNRITDLDIKLRLTNCKNCSTDTLCSCEDCAIKHILACGLVTPPVSPVNNIQGGFEGNDSLNRLHLLRQNNTSVKKSIEDSEQLKNCVVHGSQNAMTSIIQPSLPNSNTHPSCLFPLTPGHYATHSRSQPNAPATQGKEQETNPKSACNEKGIKVPIPENFLKLIADKVIAKSIKNSDEKENETNSQNVSTSTVAVTATMTTTSTASTTTSRVPAIATSNIDNSTPPTQNPQVKSSSSGKHIGPKEVAKIVQEKPEMFCAHIKEALNKKVKEESANTSKACKDGCADHGAAKVNKESKRCDCPHCEVFESTGAHISGKFNKTRDRLRRRLNEKRKKALKEKGTVKCTIESMSDTSNNNNKVKNQEIIKDITDLVNYIEGVDKNSKNSNSEKKAAKKARRKERKLEEERLKEEERLREEERKREEERLREERKKEEERLLEEKRRKEARELQNKNKKSKMEKKKILNKTNDKVFSVPPPCANKPKVCQTVKSGPMVTIKRVMEGSNAEPTVTITLKGSTPDKDKLLYTLINGQSDLGKKSIELTNANGELTKKQKKKLKKEAQVQTIIVPEVPLTKKERKKKRQEAKCLEEQSKTKVKQTEIKSEPKPLSSIMDTENTLNLQMLRLPPGITITKVDGPAVTRKVQIAPKVNTVVNQSGPIIQTSDNRSGVIVVDTVKLKQDLPNAGSVSVVGKKSKKKKNKNKTEAAPTTAPVTTKKLNDQSCYKLSSDIVVPVNNVATSNSVVTIKNPMFYQLQETLGNKMNKSNKISENVSEPNTRSQQACIIKGANGMVTIRSPRLNGVSSTCNGHMDTLMPIHSVSPLMPDLKPVISQNTATYKPLADMKKPFNAQEILSGLPGIEITKINKNFSKNKGECKKGFQPADVSIIPTNITNGTSGDTYKLFYDNSDWSLESVFAPKDIKEDEVLDADELELEAFKRFCQQSVPPERKEKVAHLNVKDIVLKKKASGSVN